MTEKLFWLQFVAQECPMLLNDQMAQWAELHKMSGAAMKEVILQLWPVEPVPSSLAWCGDSSMSCPVSTQSSGRCA